MIRLRGLMHCISILFYRVLTICCSASTWYYTVSKWVTVLQYLTQLLQSQHIAAVGSQYIAAAGSQYIAAAGSQYIAAAGSQHAVYYTVTACRLPVTVPPYNAMQCLSMHVVMSYNSCCLLQCFSMVLQCLNMLFIAVSQYIVAVSQHAVAESQRGHCQLAERKQLPLGQLWGKWKWRDSIYKRKKEWAGIGTAGIKK